MVNLSAAQVRILQIGIPQIRAVQVRAIQVRAPEARAARSFHEIQVCACTEIRVSASGSVNAAGRSSGTTPLPGPAIMLSDRRYGAFG